jgi:hypothetical protein
LAQTVTTVDVAPDTNRVIARRSSERVLATAHLSVGVVPLPQPVSSTTKGSPGAQVSAAVAAARDDSAALDRRADLRQGAASLAVVAGLFLIAGAVAGLASRRRTTAAATPVDGATSPLIEREVSLT